MKVISAGSRTFADIDAVAQAIAEAVFLIGEVVSGGARGVDALVELRAARLPCPGEALPEGVVALWQGRPGLGAIVRWPSVPTR